LWVLCKFVDGLQGYDDTYRRLMRNEPWLALFLWFLFTFIGAIVVMGVIGLSTSATIGGWAFVLTVVASFTYFVYTGISCMYQSFKRERAELFQTIKNS
jgi:ABC-type multidrug transport system fused ATPase/permease subunit